MNTSNFINLIGRLGNDPVTKALPNGTFVTEFSLATNDRYRDRDGIKQVRTDWHRVKAFGKLAELLDQYFKKGQQISVVGSMRYQTWVDKHDQKRKTAEVHVNSFSFIEGQKSKGDGYKHDISESIVSDPLPAGRSMRTKIRRKKTITFTALDPVL